MGLSKITPITVTVTTSMVMHLVGKVISNYPKYIKTDIALLAALSI